MFLVAATVQDMYYPAQDMHCEALSAQELGILRMQSECKRVKNSTDFSDRQKNIMTAAFLLAACDQKYFCEQDLVITHALMDYVFNNDESTLRQIKKIRPTRELAKILLLAPEHYLLGNEGAVFDPSSLLSKRNYSLR